MLYRKIRSKIKDYITSDHNKILLVDGARQIGKSFIIRDIGRECFPGYIEINLAEDKEQEQRFASVHTVRDFYLQVSMLAGQKMLSKKETLIFLDEIQEYPHLLTLLKFLKQDDRYTYICSGSQLGIALSQTSSIPMGSVETLRMYQLDFEEFLLANGFNAAAVDALRDGSKKMESLSEETHENLMRLFRRYLLTGGLPDAVNSFLADCNIVNLRKIQSDIHAFYAADASKYESDRKLGIRRIYDMIPSTLENKKKRIVIKDIDGIKGKTYGDYEEAFEYLISAGIALEVRAISTPVFPLVENSTKNLLKLYLNDVGLLTNVLYSTNANAILENIPSINLGAVYESVVASELIAHGHKLYYYDNRHKGEVDFLINDYDNLQVLPVEVKSGKDYRIHRAMNIFLSNKDYPVQSGIVLSNQRERTEESNVRYLPVYDVMFL